VREDLDEATGISSKIRDGNEGAAAAAAICGPRIVSATEKRRSTDHGEMVRGPLLTAQSMRYLFRSMMVVAVQGRGGRPQAAMLRESSKTRDITGGLAAGWPELSSPKAPRFSQSLAESEAGRVRKDYKAKRRVRPWSQSDGECGDARVE